MFVRLQDLEDGQDLKCDVCIVGAGPAGITLALELAAAGVDVALFESGGFEYDDSVQNMYEGQPNGGHSYSLATTRQRMFGGTSNHWGGRCRPLGPLDFQQRAWVPGSGWPFPHTELEPYYTRAQSIVEIGPPEYGLDYWVNHFGARKDRTIFDDRGPVQAKIFQLSPPTNFGEVYKDAIKKASSLRCYLFLNAVRIDIGGLGDEVQAIRFQALSGKRVKCSAKRYVLAVGGIEVPRLLLYSNDVQGRGIGNANDMVGRYFHEHIFIVNAATAYLPVTWVQGPLFERVFLRKADGFEDSGWAAAVKEPSRDGHTLVSPGFGLSELAQKEHRLPNVGGWIQGNPKPVELTAEELAAPVLQVFRNSPAPVMKYNVSTLSEQSPNPESRVTLYGRRDALGVPRLRLAWRVTEFDTRSIYRTLELMGGQLAARNIGRLRLHRRPPFTDWKFGGAAHHMGTARMHDDPRRGVTDANTRVHSTKNLYIAGSATFPTGGFVNPTLTIIAMSLRLADHLTEVLRQ